VQNTSGFLLGAGIRASGVTASSGAACSWAGFGSFEPSLLPQPHSMRNIKLEFLERRDNMLN
jgi:hypothetical protein